MFCLDEKITFLRACTMLPAGAASPPPYMNVGLRYHRYAMGWEGFGSDLLHKENI